MGAILSSLDRNITSIYLQPVGSSPEKERIIENITLLGNIKTDPNNLEMTLLLTTTVFGQEMEKRLT